MNAVLLTGATGFIGSHLLEALLYEGYSVVVLKRSTSDLWRINNILNRVIVYDIDQVDLEQIFIDNKIDFVIHLATLYRKFDGGEDITDMLATNLSFPCKLIELGLRYGLKGFINTGTFFEVNCCSLPIAENAIPQPFNFYARTKLAFDTILKSYSAKQLRSVTLRIFSPYGPRDNEKLIPMLVKKAIKGEKINLSQGLQKLDFIYIDDVVQAYLSALQYCQHGEQCHQTFNVGTGNAISIREIVSIIEQILLHPIEKEWGSAAVNEIPIAFADTSKGKEVLNWESKIPIFDGLFKTIEYYRDK